MEDTHRRLDHTAKTVTRMALEAMLVAALVCSCGALEGDQEPMSEPTGARAKADSVDDGWWPPNPTYLKLRVTEAWGEKIKVEIAPTWLGEHLGVRINPCEPVFLEQEDGGVEGHGLSVVPTFQRYEYRGYQQEPSWDCAPQGSWQKLTETVEVLMPRPLVQTTGYHFVVPYVTVFNKPGGLVKPGHEYYPFDYPFWQSGVEIGIEGYSKDDLPAYPDALRVATREPITITGTPAGLGAPIYTLIVEQNRELCASIDQSSTLAEQRCPPRTFSYLVNEAGDEVTPLQSEAPVAVTLAWANQDQVAFNLEVLEPGLLTVSIAARGMREGGSASETYRRSVPLRLTSLLFDERH